MKRLLASLLAVAVGACALPPMHGNWKNPIMSPMDHVSCRPVAMGKYRNSGCVA